MAANASVRLAVGLSALALVLPLAAPGAAQAPEPRPGSYREHEARALTDLAQAAASDGKIDESLNFLFEALAIYRQIRQRAGAAGTLYEIARINNQVFNYEAAVPRLLEAAALYRELGAGTELARVNLALGRSQMMLGRRLDAIGVLEEALGEFTRSGETRLAEEARALLGRLR
jgi:tetratricopeptide (TPR) repeat protein